MESGAFFMLKNMIHRKKKTAVAMIAITLVFTIFLSYQVFFRNNETEALSK